MKPEYKKEAALRLKIAAGHLESVRRMVDDETYCVDLMKQLSAVQSSPWARGPGTSCCA